METGTATNRKKYWGKGIILGKRQEPVYHPYTRIGFVFTNEFGKPI